jgi:enterochelin esterase-like enzyme
MTITTGVALLAISLGCRAPSPPGDAVPAATAPAPDADPGATSSAATTPTASPTTSAPSTSAPTTATAPPASVSPCTEPTGHVDARTFHSDVLAIDQPEQHYLVYTPACYRADAPTRYPVVYLLHGAQADEHQWEQVGLFSTADRLMAEGTIAPMVLVTPDAIWAMGSYDGDPPLLDRLMFGELLPAVEAGYRVRTDRSGRAIGGISRGGEWALLLAGRHPDQFAAVGGHSPAVGAPSTPDEVLVPVLSSLPRPAIRLDVGASDGLLDPVRSLDRALQAAGVAHETHVDPGSHGRPYWQAHTADYLEFYSRALSG